MSNYDKLKSLIMNKVTHFSQIDTSEPIKTEVESESNKSRKPGRPKLPIRTTEEIILEEYKKLEMSYNLLELEYKILQKELEIALNENELMKLKDIRNNMQNK